MEGGRRLTAMPCCTVHPLTTPITYDLSIVCFDSTAGTYGKDTPRNGCISCPAGKFNDVEQQTTAGNCKGCPTGQFSTALAVTQASFCNPCGAGYYGDQTGLSAQPGALGGCKICGAGTFNTETNKRYVEDCVSCVYGYYQTQQGQASCIACEKGKYNDAFKQTTESSCKSCGEGKFNSAQGASGAGHCSPCPLGRYSDEQGVMVSESSWCANVAGCKSCKGTNDVCMNTIIHAMLYERKA